MIIRLAIASAFAVLAMALLAPASAAAAGEWAWPVRGDVITPFRNGDDPYASGQHRGIDVSAPVGEAVVAAVPGTVTFAGTAGSSGLTINVRSADGAHDVSYLHLSAAGVRRGDVVARGQRIGAVGVSGRRSSSAPHLHLGVREAGSPHGYLDPLRFLSPRSVPPRAQPPAAAPVAVRAPHAVPPAAAPVPGPGWARIPRARRLPGRVRAPEARPFEASRRASPPLAHGPRRRPTLEPLPSRRLARPTRSAAGRPAPAAGPRSRTGLAAPAPVAPAESRTQTAPSPSRAVAEPRRHDRGLDLGWLAACIGLVVLAAVLAHPAKAAARPGRRSLIATLVKPLANRG